MTHIPLLSNGSRSPAHKGGGRMQFISCDKLRLFAIKFY